MTPRTGCAVKQRPVRPALNARSLTAAPHHIRAQRPSNQASATSRVPVGPLRPRRRAACRCTLREVPWSLWSRGAGHTAHPQVAQPPTAAARPPHPPHGRPHPQARTPRFGKLTSPSWATEAAAALTACRCTLRAAAWSLWSRGAGHTAHPQVAQPQLRRPKPHPPHGRAHPQARTPRFGKLTSPSWATEAAAARAACRCTLRAAA